MIHSDKNVTEGGSCRATKGWT